MGYDRYDGKKKGEEGRRGKYSITLLLLYICALSMGIAYGAHVPLVPVFAREVLDATYTEVGMIGMANYIPYAFFPFMVGLLLDRINKGSILLSGVGMALASIAMLSLARSVVDLALIRAFSGIAHAFFWPSAEAIISMSMRVDRYSKDLERDGSYSSSSNSSSSGGRDKGSSNSSNSNSNSNSGSGSSSSNGSSLSSVRSISRFTMAWVSGYMIGPLIGSSLFHLGYLQLFIYSSTMIIPALVCSIIIILLSMKKGYPDYSIKNGQEEEKGRIGISKAHLTLMSLVKGRIMLIAMIMYYSASFAILLSIVPSYMKDNGVDEQLIGILFFIFGIARLLTLLSIQLFARYEHISILIASSAIASSMLIMHTAPTPPSFGVALLALGFAFSIYFPITLTMLTRYVPITMIGSMVGLYETVFGIGWALGPIASGVVADAFSIDAPYLAMFFVGIVIIPLYTMLRLKDGTITKQA
ncbi:MAG: MFS transporter [Candidatus Nitrosocaldus sp.]